MLISFSVPKMLPMLINGLLIREGTSSGCSVTPDVVDWYNDTIRHKYNLPRLQEVARSKFQTIRAQGADLRYTTNHKNGLDIWWKSRTSERKKLGVIDKGCWKFECIRMEHIGCRVDILVGPWIVRSVAKKRQLAIADGFDNVTEFYKYFTPEPGDQFSGFLIKW
jgi:hypothetical protein